MKGVEQQQMLSGIGQKNRWTGTQQDLQEMDCQDMKGEEEEEKSMFRKVGLSGLAWSGSSVDSSFLKRPNKNAEANQPRRYRTAALFSAGSGNGDFFSKHIGWQRGLNSASWGIAVG